MTRTDKPFEEWDISDFTYGGSFADRPIDRNSRPFFGFCKIKKEGQKPQSKGYVIRVKPSEQ